MIDPQWLKVALEPPRAFGPHAGRGRMRVEPEDFLVEEELGFEPSGAGQHVLLKVRKRNANTEWVARALARCVGCRPSDVGYAGLKDRHAVAVQWFSVPYGLDPEQCRAVRGEGFEVLEAHPHARKLPRGALAANRFCIRIRALDADPDLLRERLEQVASRGVPNYFGPQRFGRNGANLSAIGRDPRTLRSTERGLMLSSARSLIFNAVLGERVCDGSWERLEEGDVANLDGRGSVFAVGELDPELARRCERLEIHPTGPLWGAGPSLAAGRIRELEERAAAQFAAPAEMTVGAGMEQERRSLRLAVRDFAHEITARELVVRFRLGRGSFATAVIREIVDVDADAGSESEP